MVRQLSIIITSFVALLSWLPTTGSAQETFELVTDAASLQAGQSIVIANLDAGVALSTTQNNNNRGQVAVTISGNTLTANSSVQVLTLGGSAGAWTFYTGSGYLYMAGANSSNKLKTEDTVDERAQAVISLSGNDASITFNGSGTRNSLEYNSSASIFSCYTAGTQSPVAIFRSSATPAVDRQESLAQFNALDNGTTADLYLADSLMARVVYVSNDTVMLKDNTGVTRLVGIETNPQMTFGDHVAGYVRAQLDTSDGIPTMKPVEETNSAYLVIADPVTESDVDEVSPTNIVNLEQPSIVRGRIYTLSGQYMGNDISKLPAGVYIRDGKKLIVNN